MRVRILKKFLNGSGIFEKITLGNGIRTPPSGPSLLICLMFLPIFLCYSLIITWEFNRMYINRKLLTSASVSKKKFLSSAFYVHFIFIYIYTFSYIYAYSSHLVIFMLIYAFYIESLKEKVQLERCSPSLAMISFELVSIIFAMLFLHFMSHHQVQAGENRQKLFLQLINLFI